MRSTFRVALCFLFAVAVSITIGWAEEPPIALKVEPQTSFVSGKERAYRRVIIHIPRHEDNRNVRLEWDSENGEAGATERQLSGNNSPYVIEGASLFGRTSGLMLPAGKYVLRVTLTRGGKRFSATVETSVVLAGEEF